MDTSQEISRLPTYKGEAWRAESGYTHGRRDTAGDVIRFERDELGNDFGLPEALIKELDQYHASDLIWVTRKRDQCLRYLSEGESDECVAQPYLGATPRIVADTGEEGFLVLHGDAVPMSQWTQTAAAAISQEMMMQPQTGTCYQDAFRYLKEHEDATLVHGTVQHITREGLGRTGHAWVELPDGTIWEPENKIIITKEQFEVSKPEVIKRYNFTAAAIEILKHSHYGPWHEENMPQTVAKPINKEFMEAPIYPRVLTMADYEKIWKPEGWNIIFIGPTSTWRQDWGAWEAIRDIVQNCLDEAESYQWGYDDEGLWIADQGRGVAVADFLLGPPKLKPDYARGKYGEGMKISALAMVRSGYPVVIKTVRRELRIIFLEQDVGGSHVESLAALWRPNGTDIGTTFHFIGYNGDAFPERFAVNLPREAILFQGNSLINEPRTRFNQLIDTQKVMEMKQSLSIFPQQSIIYARDIYMTDINSLYSYNLWDFELAPDRFAPKQFTDMYRSIGRLWATCEDPELIKIFLQMVKDPPILETAESRQVELSYYMGANPATGINYIDIMKQNQWAWQKAWDSTYGEGVVLRTDEKWDAMVRHLGYTSVSVSFNVADAFRRVFKRDSDLISESQARLRDVDVIPDEKLGEREKLNLILARAIVNDVARHRRVGGVHAAIIPPASDRVRTAGLYGRSTEEIFIAADQLTRGRTTVDTTIHELAHHTTGAEDGEEAHNKELSRLGGRVVELTALQNYDDIIRKPSFQW